MTRHLKFNVMISCLLFLCLKVSAYTDLERKTIMCERAHGEVSGSACRCPLSSALSKKSVLINPFETTCTDEIRCLQGHGYIDQDQCKCLLDSLEHNTDIVLDPKKVFTSSNTLTARSDYCKLDRECTDRRFGKPTLEGCYCPLEDRIVDMKNTQDQCGLGLVLKEKNCPSSFSKPDDRVFSQEIGSVHYFNQQKSLPATWKEFFDLFLEKPSFRDTIDGVDLINRWVDKNINTDNNSLISQIKPVMYKCQDGNGWLYPTHPEQLTKVYHYYVFGYYDLVKMRQPNTADESYCLIGMNSGRRSCQEATQFAAVIASDLFSDSCGNIYRGFWHHGFLRKYEAQPDLFSRGKTQFVDQVDVMSGAYKTVTGHTYAIRVDDLFLLSEPVLNDLEKMQKMRTQAIISDGFDLKCGVFIPR